MKTFDEVHQLALEGLWLSFPRLKGKDITLRSNLKKDFNLDSLDHVDFMCAVEELYGATIIDKDLYENREKDFQEAATKTFADIIRCLQFYINKIEGEQNV